MYGFLQSFLIILVKITVLAYAVVGIRLHIYEAAEALPTQDLQMTHLLDLSLSDGTNIIIIGHFNILQNLFSTAGYWTVQSAEDAVAIGIGFKKTKPSLLFALESSI